MLCHGYLALDYSLGNEDHAIHRMIELFQQSFPKFLTVSVESMQSAVLLCILAIGMRDLRIDMASVALLSIT